MTFEIYSGCEFLAKEESNWIDPTISFLSLIVAGIALYFAIINLKGLRRTQNIQTMMHLVQLEKDVYKNKSDAQQRLRDYNNLQVTEGNETKSREETLNNEVNKLKNEKDGKAKKAEISKLEEVKKAADDLAGKKLEEERKVVDTANELLYSAADKLAFIINAEEVVEQFEGRRWEGEYKELFSTIMQTIVNQESSHVRNIKKLLDNWKKGTPDDPKRWGYLSKKRITLAISAYCNPQNYQTHSELYRNLSEPVGGGGGGC